MIGEYSSAVATVERLEAELLLLCAGTCRDPERDARIAALLRGELDWEYLLGTAHRHGVASLLYWNLNATLPEAVPKEILDHLREHFLVNSRRSLFLTGELLRLLNKFEAQGVPVVPYKGPTLAALAYGNLALREFMDLDILVRRRDVAKARDVLFILGYRQQEQLADAQAEAFLKSHCEYVFTNDNGSVVELHWAILPRNLSFSFEAEDLWERLESTMLGGATIDVFSPEDVLLILCVHGSKHRWERLAWTCDVAELIRTHPQIEWDRVMVRARALGGERMMLLGVFLAGELLGVALPEEVLQRARADLTVNDLARRVTEQTFRPAVSSLGLLEDSSFKPLYLKMRERLPDKIRYCFYTATARSVKDWELARLPRFLFPLYYVIRLGRLAGKYGRGLLGHTP